MKQQLILLFTLLLFVAPKFSDAQGFKIPDNERTNQYATTKSKVLKTSFLNVLWGTMPFTSEYYIKYESRISPQNTFAVGASFLGKNLFLDALMNTGTTSPNANISYMGYRIQGELRHYLENLSFSIFSNSKYSYAPLGFYFSANASYAAMEINSKPTASALNFYEVQQFFITANMGVQFNLLDLAWVDLFIGYGYKSNEWTIYKNGNPKPYLFEATNTNYYTNRKYLIGWNVGIPLK